MKLTYKELKKDLNKKCPSDYHKRYDIDYFSMPLFKRDNVIYRRRTFSDLFLYYRYKGVSEKQLLKALYEEGFMCYLCSDIEQCVFFKWDQCYKFWRYNKSSLKEMMRKPCYTKYTIKYLDELFDSIIF